MGNGGTVELSEGGEEWRGDGSLVGRHEHKAVDRDDGGDGVLVEYLRRRMRGGERKGAGDISDIFYQHNGWLGKEGGSGAESAWKSETNRERGA
jgi:hypothetical protein